MITARKYLFYSCCNIFCSVRNLAGFINFLNATINHLRLAEWQIDTANDHQLFSFSLADLTWIVFSLSSRSSWRGCFSPGGLARSPSLWSTTWNEILDKPVQGLLRVSPVNVVLQVCHFLPLSLHGTLESDQHLYQVLEWYSQSTDVKKWRLCGILISQCRSHLIYFPVILCWYFIEQFLQCDD